MLSDRYSKQYKVTGKFSCGCISKGQMNEEAEAYMRSRGGGIGGAGGATTPPIFLEIGEILGFCTPNISGLKEGVARKSHKHPQYFTSSATPEVQSCLSKSLF